MTDFLAFPDAAAARRFLCDEMLGGLARWLRAAGYDTAMAEHRSCDAELVARAAGQERLLLTRDRKMLERRGAWRHVLILRGQSTEAWAEEMRHRLSLAWWHAPFTRCLLCNTPLEALPEAAGSFTWCPACRKTYWPGSHTRRMAACLRRWEAGGEEPSPRRGEGGEQGEPGEGTARPRRT